MSFSPVATRAWLRSAMFVAALLLAISPFAAATCPSSAQQQLQKQLGQNVSVTRAVPAGHERWSQYAAPHASLYVIADKEADVATVVKFANRYNYTFLLRNGGNGWADTFDLQGCSIIIDISELNNITFNHDKTLVTIQGGVGVEQLVAQAYENNARVATATCNCVGFLGAALGGGQTRQSGLYGLSVDQLVSLNVVLASGESVCIDAKSTSHPGLWWALGGAGANFGLVTSATVKSYPIPAASNTAWTGLLIYPESQVEAVMRAIDDIDLKPNMQVDFEFFTSGAPSYTAAVGVLPFFIGSNTSAAEAAFKSLLQLNPTTNTATQVPYNQWNSGSTFCDKGPRKPAYGATLPHIVPSTWVQVFKEFKAFVASNPAEFGLTTVAAEVYPVAKALAIGNRTSSYPFRSLGHHVIAIPYYSNASYDAVANAWGAKIRSLWWGTAGTPTNYSYINFAHGDEQLASVYGDSLSRLQQLKKIYDPKNRFNQWFPLTPR